MSEKTNAGNMTMGGTPGVGPPRAFEENVEVIKGWEQTALHSRSTAEQLADWITASAASGPVLALHLGWFAFWIAANSGLIPGIATFDPYPFSVLTMTVSLEAIILTLLVLASQKRLARQSDKRAHLDLQINLLAEREMTAVLQLLQDIAQHLEVRGTVTPEQIRDLVKETDIHALTHKVDEVSEPNVVSNRSSSSVDGRVPANPSDGRS